MGLYIDGYHEITRVVFHDPEPEIAERYPFACVFKEATKEEAASEELIQGIYTRFDDKEYIACSADGETLIFNVDRECEEAEQERLGIEPAKVEKEDVKLSAPMPGKLILPGQPNPPTSAGAIIKEEWGKAWAVTAITDPSPELVEKIEKLLGRAL